MGMFDSVWVPCPKCGRDVEYQSKGGDCTLADYTLETAPLDVLMYVIDNAERCDGCGSRQYLTLVEQSSKPRLFAIAPVLDDAALNAIADERANGPFVRVTLEDLANEAQALAVAFRLTRQRNGL